MFWGLSESLDLYQEYLNALKTKQQNSAEKVSSDNGDVNKPTPDGDVEEMSESTADTINILIYGAGDPRHIIHTMSKLYKCQTKAEDTKEIKPFINFYMLEGCIEILARNILLLGIALESDEELNLYNKAHLFMDIYGNSLIRPTSHNYIVSKSKALIRMFSDDEYLNRFTSLIDMAALKYRERDGLTNAFNFWQPKDDHFFNIKEYWGTRSRKLLGARYDHRNGAFDWDLNMTLKARKGQQICSQEYRYWRETGIAFTFPEYEQCKPNKSFVAGIVQNGKGYIHRGYVGDIQTGPFCAFGLNTSDTKMLQSVHGTNDYRATDITERNILEFLYELMHRKNYVHDPEISRKYGAAKLLMGKRFIYNEVGDNLLPASNKPWLNIDGVKIHFLSADEILNFQKINDRWQNVFDVAFVGHNYFPFLKEKFTDILKENALLILETQLLTCLRKDDIKNFEKKLFDYAMANGFENVINYNVLNTNNSVLKFRKITPTIDIEIEKETEKEIETPEITESNE